MMFRLAAFAAVLAALAGCSRESEFIFPCHFDLKLVSGNNQRGAPGTTLPEVLEVQLTGGSFGCFPQSIAVGWAIESGGGTVTPETLPPGHTARAKWTLGPAPGTQTVRATWQNGAERPSALFTAIAEAPR